MALKAVETMGWYQAYQHTCFSQVASCFHEGAKIVTLFQIKPSQVAFCTAGEFPALQDNIKAAYDAKKAPFYEPGQSEPAIPFESIFYKSVGLAHLAKELRVSSEDDDIAIVASCAQDDMPQAKKIVHEHNAAAKEKGLQKVRISWATANDVYKTDAKANLDAGPKPKENAGRNTNGWERHDSTDIHPGKFSKRIEFRQILHVDILSDEFVDAMSVFADAVGITAFVIVKDAHWGSGIFFKDGSDLGFQVDASCHLFLKQNTSTVTASRIEAMEFHPKKDIEPGTWSAKLWISKVDGVDLLGQSFTNAIAKWAKSVGTKAFVIVKDAGWGSGVFLKDGSNLTMHDDAPCTTFFLPGCR